MSEELAGPEASDHELEQTFALELAARNGPALFWSHVAFSVIYLLWGVLDSLEAPGEAGRFLSYRVAAVGIATVIVFSPAGRSSSPTSSWVATCLWFAVWAAGVGAMLPDVGNAHLTYAVGLSMIGLGTGVLPFWPVKWAIGTFVLVGILGMIGAVGRPTWGVAEAAQGSIAYLTIGAGAMIAAVLKYRFALTDYRRRQELRRVLEQLRQAHAEKTRLFHNVSHELRTPLTMILAPLDEWVYRNADVDEDVLAMRRNAQRLLRLVDDILELSKFDSASVTLNVQRVDVAAIAERVVQMLRTGAERKGLQISLENPPSEEMANVDAARIETVLTNLIGNAIKYTPRGGSILVRVIGDTRRVVLEVEDDGVGIPTTMRDKIFDRYTQIGEKAVGGVGIGLSLAKELVELHGGILKVESEPGTGSKFSAELPRDELELVAELTHGEPLSPIEERSFEAGSYERQPSDEFHGTVLVVDDEPDVRHLVSRVLQPGWNVLEAEDGLEALDLVREQRPDLVVMDVMMPRMDGLAFLKELRADPSIAHTSVIALTAARDAEAETTILAHGADDYLPKPFHPAVLRARVQLQQRLRQLVLSVAAQEKLAVIGTLAAGILHEVNNPANAIISASSLVKHGTDEARLDQVREIIRSSGERVVKLTAAMRNHARPSEHDVPRPFALKQGIESTLEILRHTLKGMSKVYLRCADDLEVYGPPAAINQVFLNLVENAAKSGARNIWIEADQRAENEVVISVRDDGPGIPESDRRRVFDPFFTTRPVGEGTGLGLYLCRRTMTDSGGTIEVVPSRTGARFRLTIPSSAVEEPLLVHQGPRAAGEASMP